MTVGYNSNPNRLESSPILEKRKASVSKKRVLSSRETLPLAVIDLKRNDFCIWGFISILLCVLGRLAFYLPIGLEPGISFHQMLRQNLWMVNLAKQLYQQDSYIFFSIVFHCFGFEDSLYMGIGVPFVAFSWILFKCLDLKHFHLSILLRINSVYSLEFLLVFKLIFIFNF